MTQELDPGIALDAEAERRLPAAVTAGLASVSAALAACGGGDAGAASADEPEQTAPPPAAPLTEAQASRFLHQATMGPTLETIDDVKRRGIKAWLDEQFEMRRSMSLMERMQRNLPDTNLHVAGTRSHNVPELFYEQAVTERAQLRCRVAWALSQILVASYSEPRLEIQTSSLAHFNDMLHDEAFGNYRNILLRASRSTVMGYYLTFITPSVNKNITPGFKPDENYARELMQLFSIGVTKLNIDGTPQLDAKGAPVPSYGPNDILELAKVFTGYTEFANPFDKARDAVPQQINHIGGPKTFLGKTIEHADMVQELELAIDVIFNHQNVGPFLASRLITKLVTSNPSPAYIRRVAQRFNDDGTGVRGNLKAVVEAILLDEEARTPPERALDVYGKFHEPVLMLTNVLRLEEPELKPEAAAAGRGWDFDDTSSELSLWQSPYNSPSVFNFYDAEYVSPGSRMARRGLVSPEFQLFNSITALSMLNYLKQRITNVPSSFINVVPTFKGLLPLASSPRQLVNAVDLVLTAASHSDQELTEMARAIEQITVPTSGDPKLVLAAQTKRVSVAIILITHSPMFVVRQ